MEAPGQELTFITSLYRGNFCIIKAKRDFSLPCPGCTSRCLMILQVPLTSDIVFWTFPSKSTLKFSIKHAYGLAVLLNEDQFQPTKELDYRESHTHTHKPSIRQRKLPTTSYGIPADFSLHLIHISPVSVTGNNIWRSHTANVKTQKTLTAFQIIFSLQLGQAKQAANYNKPIIGP